MPNWREGGRNRERNGGNVAAADEKERSHKDLPFRGLHKEKRKTAS